MHDPAISRAGSAGRQQRGAGRLIGLETDQPPLQGGLALEQDKQRVVAGDGADLVLQARLVDRLGNRSGRARCGNQNEAQAASPDVNGDVLEEAT